MSFRAVHLIAVASLFWVCGIAQCDEEVTSESPPSQVVKKNAKVKAKGNATREKETEGTEAPDRFEADTVIKSQYKLDNKPLEVDPD